MQKTWLTNNQLKLIALLTMTVDHIGLLLFPKVLFLRIIGRLAFPIFAYMVAEGCRYTRNQYKYLGSLVLIAFLCQVVSYVATRSLEQCILVTFSFSVFLIILLQKAISQKDVFSWGLFILATGTVFVITWLLPEWIPGTDFSVDYGFMGVMLPVCVYAAENKKTKLAISALCLGVMASSMWPGQWFALLTLPLLALYNGQRGKWRMKWLFYLYYPLHLAVLWAIALFF